MPTLVLLWVWFCAYLNCAGWALSALHALDSTGYETALLIFFISVYIWQREAEEKFVLNFNWRQILYRFRKPFPMGFAILSAMAILGGILYPPTNYDAMSYRLPRILHWLAADQWHWIHTIFDRVNDRSCGIEWVSAPVIAIFNTDRPLFLINAISFLFLPGLIYSVFIQLGINRKVTWYWMWILPTAYGLLLQAGSIGNDMFGATFALAALDFALRARSSGVRHWFYASVLAAAMMTSAKTSNLPLLLPWAIAIWPSWRFMSRWAAVCTVIMAIFASALPTMYFNEKYYQDWSGAGLNRRPTVEHAVALRTAANVVLLAVGNLVPPVFPQAEQWNASMDKLIPQGLEDKLQHLIETPGCRFHVSQMQMEESSGMGLGVSALLITSIIGALFYRREEDISVSQQGWQSLILFSPLISFAAILAVSDLSGIARLLVPYYPLLVPMALAGNSQSILVKQIWWRLTALIVFPIAALLLIVNPSRPLFPVQTFLERCEHAGIKLPARVKVVYSTYANRYDAFGPAIATLPAGIKTVGVVIHDDPEASLWRPFGSRQVIHVCPDDTALFLQLEDVQYVLLPKDSFQQWFGCSVDEWLKRRRGQIIKTIPLNLRASVGPTDWYLVKLQQRALAKPAAVPVDSRRGRTRSTNDSHALPQRSGNARPMH